MATPTAVFPAAVATAAQLKVANNLIQSQLRVGVDAANTILFVNSTAGFAANMLVSIDKEIIAIASVVDAPNPALLVGSGGRGFDATAAAAHAAGAKVSVLIDAWHHNALSTEIQAIEQALGPNLSNIGTGMTGVLQSAAYDFAPITPGGSLSAGLNVITIPGPVPSGVSGTNTNHYLYIDQGTGAPEAVLVSGGTAVSGGPTGTLFINCGHAHSGAWRIGSATEGMQEALWGAPGSGSCVILLPTIAQNGPLIVHAATTVPVQHSVIAIKGQGKFISGIQRAADYPSGDIFYYNQTASASGSIEFSDFAIYGSAQGANNSSGAAIHIKGITNRDGFIGNIHIEDGYTGIWLENAARVNIDGYSWLITSAYASVAGFTPPLAGIHVSGSSGEITVCNSRLLSQPDDAALSALNAIVIRGCDGLQLANCHVKARVGISVQGGFGGHLTNLIAVNLVIDRCTVKGFEIIGPNVGFGFGNIKLSDSTVTAYSQGVTPQAVTGIDLNGIGGTQIPFILSDNLIAGWRDTGIRLLYTGSAQVQISGGVITQLGTAAAHANAIGVGDGANGWTVDGVDIRDGGALVDTAILLSNSSNVRIENNNLTGAGVPLSVSGHLTASVVQGNVGIDNVIAAVASAATIALPVNPIFRITGTTNITAVTSVMPAGSRGLLRTDSPITFTAGASIGNNFTTVANVPVPYYWDETKFWVG